MSQSSIKIISPPQQASERAADIHSPFIPFEVYQGENIKAVVRIPNSDTVFELPVWRMSPLGIELAIDSTTGSQFQMGHALDLELTIKKQKCSFKGLVVSQQGRERNVDLIGIRWFAEQQTQNTPGSERRSHRRWLCGEEFLPTGIAPNPLRFGDFIHFRIKDLSKGGLRIFTSLRNRYIIPGMELTTTISFPMFGQAQVRVKVIDVRVQSDRGKDFLSIGASLINPQRSLLSMIANYVLQFSPNTNIDDVKSDSLLPKTVADKVSYSYAKTKEDFEEVLKLRLVAYRQSGKIDPNRTAEEMGDSFDTRSRILMARYRGKLVSTMRIMFHDSEDSLEHERFAKIPDWFPRKDEFVEVTRFCIDPHWQGGDLIFGMMRQLFLVMAHAGRRYAVSSATKDMMDSFYLKFGAQLVGDPFRHGDLADHDHYLFLFDISKVIKGQTVGPILWNLLLADVYDYVVSNDYYSQDPLTAVRIRFYRLFRPLADLLRSKLMRPRESKKSLSDKRAAEAAENAKAY